MTEDNSDDKPFEATQKRLDDLRKQGRIPRSPDLLTAASYAGFLLAIMGAGLWSLDQIGTALAMFLDRAGELAGLMHHGARAAVPGILSQVALGLAPLILLPACAVLLMVAVQRAYVFTPDNLMPKLSRISPLATAAQKFGRAGLVEFAKNSLKLCLVALILGAFLLARLDEMLGTLYLTPLAGTAVLFRLLVDFLLIVLLIAAVIGGFDYLWQWFEHGRNNRMSRQDMLEEHKDSDGDPHAKSHRRQRGQEIAMNRMLQNVPKADVVIVNPTHYAVALAWDRQARRAPVCVAKGVDAMAAQIRQQAAQNGVPIHSDPPTARALHATVEIGAEIQREHFKAVAAAIRFAEAMRKQAKGRRR